MPPTAQNIADQRERLAHHRANVQTLLQQIAAQGGWMHAPLALLNTLSENRAQIAQCKAVLRGWAQAVEDHADDAVTAGAQVLDQQIGELEASRALPLPTAVREAVEQALQGAQERRAALQVHITASADRQEIRTGDASTISEVVQVQAGGDVQGNVLLRDITIAEGGVLNIGALPAGLPPRPEAVEQALRRYLETLLQRYQFLSLQGLGAGGTQPLRITLRSVFVNLRTDWRISQVERPRDEGHGRQSPWVRDVLVGLLEDADTSAWLKELATPEQLALLQAVPEEDITDEQPQQLQQLLIRLRAPRTAIELIRHEPALVLLGDPGSGKTTVLRHLALGFALARLGAGSREPEPLDRELAWRGPLPLPILIQVRRLAEELRGPPADAGPLLTHLERTLSGDRLDVLAQHLVTRLEAGNVLVLCDGLDEVPDDLRRAWAAQAVALFQNRFPRSRIVLTSRVYAYRGTCQLPPPFQVATLQPLESYAQDDFIRRWYRAGLLQGERVPAEQEALAASKAHDLTGALERRPRLREIGANPLLLTMMALVHLHRLRLPQQRAALYDECLHLLLEQWEQRRADGPAGLAATLGIPEQTNRLALIQPIAYQLQVCGREEARQAELRDWLLPRFLDLQRDVEAAKALIGRFLSFLEGRSGLLIARDIQDRYAFPHRTLQEYLVARELIYQGMRVATQEALVHRHAARWREVILLMVGHLVVSGQPHEARELGWQLLQQDAEDSPAWYRNVVLAGEIAEELEAVPGLEGQAFRAEVIKRLVALVQGGHLPAKERVEAAFTLARLGDPRLPKPEQPDYWCSIDAGPFWHGDETKDEALQQLILPYNYRIGRYPVTNDEYQLFLADGGSDMSQPWWTEQGRTWMAQRERTEPSWWNDPQYNVMTQPVVGVMWYEAMAYCSWLTMRGHREGWLPHEVIIRLPTYAEWVRAARHTDQRRYPWGVEAPNPERANYDATEIGRPTPVGCFPQGSAECGAQDLQGNVWEWTATMWEQPWDMAPEVDPERSTGIVWAGRAFLDRNERLGCGAREWDYSDNEGSYLGFRAVWSPHSVV
jgi:formylglycine-generating enzyme required for sulfatase activity